MKIGIVGSAERAIAWEHHLRPHHIVHEVDLCANINEVGEVDACFIIDDTEENLNILLAGIKQELNCFLISKTPTDRPQLENIYHAANEAGVRVQFSQWPVLAPATQWMMNRIKKPKFLNIRRELSQSLGTITESEFDQIWYDELGLCLKWINSGLHHIEAKKLRLENNNAISIHLFLRFDNGSTADIFIYSGSENDHHQRILFSKQEVMECDVKHQKVRVGRLNNSGQLFFERQQFEPAKAAEKAALLFLKSVQMKSDPPYSAYDAYQFSIFLEKVELRLKQFV